MVHSISPYYKSDDVTRLVRVLQEATRATTHGDPATYVAPAGGERAEAAYNHFVFGPRGSGKTSLLRHVEAQLESQQRPSVWIDQEVFSNLSYPDVLVSAVLEIMTAMASAVDERKRSIEESTARRPLFGYKAEVRDHLRLLDVLASRLRRFAANLDALKFTPADRKVEWVQRTETVADSELGGRVQFRDISVSGTSRHSDGSEVQSTEVVESSKEEYLERSLVDFRMLLESAIELCGGGFVFVDDLYLLATDDQPLILGYLHRLVKNLDLWLKVGSIRHFTRTYRAGDPPVGMEPNHDALEVALDRGLQLYESTRAFLTAILEGLAGAADVDLDALFTDGARDRLTLASGGVARDYIRLIVGSIEQARNRTPTDKTGTHRIIVEDVNRAAALMFASKLDAVKVDAPDRASAVNDRVRNLTEYCRSKRRAYFLVSVEEAELTEEMEELQHLRLTHLLQPSETIPDKGSERFNVWMLDVAALAYQRLERQTDFDGWRNREKRRNRGNIYTLSWQDEVTVQPQRDKHGRFITVKGPKEAATSDREQRLFDDL